MDSSGTLELQLEAIKVRGKRVRVAVGVMKDWFFLVKIIIGSRCIVHGNGLFGFGGFLFLFVLQKPWTIVHESKGKIGQKPCVMELGGKGQGEK